MDAGQGFPERLLKAAAHAKVPYKPQALADRLETTRSKVHIWMNGSLPRADTLFMIAEKLGVDARWLATGEGDMIARAAPQGLPLPEAQLIARYRAADPRWQLSLRLLAALATEDQVEAATDVNMVMARILGKKPAEVRYASNEAVAAAFGDAPHVAARKRKEREK
jgi:transcriptional regulator with XRE-family HTH domain